MTLMFIAMITIDVLVIGLIVYTCVVGDITKCKNDLLSMLWLLVGVIGGFPLHFLIDNIRQLFTFKKAFCVETVATLASLVWLCAGTALTVTKSDCANMPLFITCVVIVSAHWILFFGFMLCNLLTTLPAAVCKLWASKK